MVVQLDGIATMTKYEQLRAAWINRIVVNCAVFACKPKRTDEGEVEVKQGEFGGIDLGAKGRRPLKALGPYEEPRAWRDLAQMAVQLCWQLRARGAPLLKK